MPAPLTRPIQNHSNVRRTSGADLTVSLGDALGSVFSTPLETRLLTESYQRAGARRNILDDEQIGELRESERERFAEIRRLNGELQSSVLNQTETDQIYTRLQQLEAESQVGLNRAIQQSVEDGRAIAPDQLSEKYSELGLSFDRPMTNEEAEMLADLKRAEIVRNAIISKSPQGIGPGAAKFGTALVAAATDPLGIAAMFVPVVSQSRSLALIRRLGSVRGRAAIGAIEGGVGTALFEPIYYGLSEQAQLDYAMSESLFNVGAGVVLGGALGAGIGTLLRGGATPPADRAAAEAGPGTTLPDVAPTMPGGPARRPSSLERQSTELALKQFVNDQPISVNRFFDGTDLRSTTAISSVRGVAFQRGGVIEGLDELQRRSTYLVADSDGPLLFKDIQTADAMAIELGGRTVKVGDKFQVERRAKGEILRSPNGEPVAFKLRSEADELVNDLREQGLDVTPVFRDEDADWVVAEGMDEEDIESLQGNGGNFSQQVIDTKQAAIRSSDDDPSEKSLKGAAAEQEMVRNVAVDQRAAEEVSDEAIASAEVQEEFSERVLREAEELAQEIEELEAELRSEGVFDEADPEAFDVIRFQALPLEVENFYSPLYRGLSEAKQTKARAAEWGAVLKKLPGVKQHEMDWMGVRNWLDEQPGVVTKEELMNYVAASRVPIEEISTETNISRGAELRQEISNVVGELESLIKRLTGRDRVTILDDDGNLSNEWFENEYDELLSGQDDPEGTQLLDRYYGAHSSLESGRTEDYSSPTYNLINYEIGSENVTYKVLRMGVPDFETGHLNKEFNEVWNSPHWDDTDFKSGRSSSIVHARTGEFTSNDKKVVFVEELQSDLNNDLRKRRQIPQNNQQRIDAKEKHDNNRARLEEEKTRIKEEFPGVFENVERMGVMMDYFMQPVGRDYLKEYTIQSVSAKSDGEPGALFEEIFNRTEKLREIRKEYQETFNTSLYLGAPVDPNGPVLVSPFPDEMATNLMTRRLLQKASDEDTNVFAWSGSEIQAARWDEKHIEGYKNVYDRQMVKIIQKMIKPFGGKVQKSTVSRVFNRSEVPINTTVERPVWYVELTPEMRAAFSRAQPMFQTPMPGSLALNPEKASDMFPQLVDELDTMGLSGVRLSLDRSAKGWQGQFKGNRYGPVDIIIGHALDPMKTLYHESIHAMRWMKLFTDKEWSTLSKSAERWMGDYEIDARYPNLSREQKIEEAVAEAFSDFADNRVRPDTFTRRVFAKMQRLLRTFRNVFGSTSAQDIFAEAYEGSIGKRDPNISDDVLAAQQLTARSSVLSPETRRELEDLTKMEEQYKLWGTAIEVAANCVGSRP